MGDIYLSHSRKGSQKPNHKYYKREWRDGRWIYFYNKGEDVKFRISNDRKFDDYIKEMKKYRNDVENDIILFDNMSPYTKEEMLKQVDKNIDHASRYKERAARIWAREVERNRKKKKPNRKNPRNMTHSATMGDIYLSHSRKGSQRPNHKYFKREWRNGRWYYYYNKKDYAKFKTDEANETKKFADEYNDLIKDDEYQARQLNRASVSGNRNQVFSLGKNPYTGNSNGWVKGGGSAKTKRDYALEADYHSRMAKNLKKERDSNYRVAENAARDAARAVTSSKSYKLKTKANSYKNKVGRNILKGKKKVVEMLSQIQRQYEGKKAGRKSAKLSKERQKRLKNKNTIRLSDGKRVTFSEVKLGRRK